MGRPKKEHKKVNIGVKADIELSNTLKALATREHMTVSALVERVLKEYVKVNLNAINAISVEDNTQNIKVNPISSISPAEKEHIVKVNPILECEVNSSMSLYKFFTTMITVRGREMNVQEFCNKFRMRPSRDKLMSLLTQYSWDEIANREWKI